MPDAPRISVVIVSFGRPRLLRRAILGVSQCQNAAFEIVVVADDAGRAAAATLPFAQHLTLLPQDQPNIAVARNAGIAAATGDIIAFIDDDAVPEPNWLSRIVAAFADGDVAAVTGLVLGRNGISTQWGNMSVDNRGRDQWVRDGGSLEAGEAVKLHGTNMAIRASVLRDLGGFDPAFEFFMDDTDLARRLAADRAKTIYAPDAIVHHGFAASSRRRDDRIPLSLFDIGASTAVFLAKHATGEDHAPDLRQLESDQRARLMRLVRRRKIGSRDVRLLMESLMQGIEAGRVRPSGRLNVTAPDRPFERFPALAEAPMTYRSGWWLRASALRAAAEADVQAGRRVTLLIFEPSPRKHKVVFTEGGWWEQTGGIFGPSRRDQARIRLSGFSQRVNEEQSRIEAMRGD